jgi:flagellar FliJ protein
MNPPQPLTALLVQTERQRDLALAEQRQAEATNATAQAKAEQLIAYRLEYEQRWSAQFCREGKIELVRCYQGFMERLTQAIDSQHRAAAAATAQLAFARAEVMKHEVKLAAVRIVVEQRLAELRRAGQRLDQKQNDELAARVAWGSRAATSRAGAP